MGGQDEAPLPTASEAMFFFSIVKHMKSIPDIDWVAVANDRCFKSPEVAKVRFGQVKRKLGISTSDTSRTVTTAAGAMTPPGSFRGSPTKVTKAPVGRIGTKGCGGGKKGGSFTKEEDNTDSGGGDDVKSDKMVMKEGEEILRERGSDSTMAGS